MKLADRVAIVTGGSKGIGLGCARTFASYGCKVVIAARGEEAGLAAEAELKHAGHEVLFVRCDVTVEDDMRELIDGTVDRHGRLDCLVNNAGWHPGAVKIDDVSIADFESLLRLNLTSTFTCSSRT